MKARHIAPDLRGLLTWEGLEEETKKDVDYSVKQLINLGVLSEESAEHLKYLTEMMFGAIEYGAPPDGPLQYIDLEDYLYNWRDDFEKYRFAQQEAIQESLQKQAAAPPVPAPAAAAQSSVPPVRLLRPEKGILHSVAPQGQLRYTGNKDSPHVRLSLHGVTVAPGAATPSSSPEEDVERGQAAAEARALQNSQISRQDERDAAEIAARNTGGRFQSPYNAHLQRTGSEAARAGYDYLALDRYGTAAPYTVAPDTPAMLRTSERTHHTPVSERRLDHLF